MPRPIALAIAAWILFSPALIQLAGWDSPFIRSWQMYGSVGVGAPYGHFRITRAGDATTTYRLLDILGLSHIRELQQYPGSGSLNQTFIPPSALVQVAEPLCRSLAPDDELIFEGRVAAPGGWIELRRQRDQLCPER